MLLLRRLVDRRAFSDLSLSRWLRHGAYADLEREHGVHAPHPSSGNDGVPQCTACSRCGEGEVPRSVDLVGSRRALMGLGPVESPPQLAAPTIGKEARAFRNGSSDRRRVYICRRFARGAIDRFGALAASSHDSSHRQECLGVPRHYERRKIASRTKGHDK